MEHNPLGRDLEVSFSQSDGLAVWKCDDMRTPTQDRIGGNHLAIVLEVLRIRKLIIGHTLISVISEVYQFGEGCGGGGKAEVVGLCRDYGRDGSHDAAVARTAG